MSDSVRVYNSAKVYGYAQVYGSAWVYNEAEIYGNAQVYGSSGVYNKAKVYDDAQVYDNALVSDGVHIYGNALIYEYADIWGELFYWDPSAYAQIYDDTEVYGYAFISGKSKIYGSAKVYGDSVIYDNVEIYDDADISGTWPDYPTIYEEAKVFGTSTVSGLSAIRACSLVEDQIVGSNELIETCCSVSPSVSPSISPSHSASPSPECYEETSRIFWVDGSGTVSGDGTESLPFTYRQLMNYFNPDLGDDCEIEPADCDTFKIYNNISFVASDTLFSVKRNLEGKVILKSPSISSYPWTIDTTGNPLTNLKFFKYVNGYSIRNIEAREFIYCQNNDGNVMTTMTDIESDYLIDITFRNIGLFIKRDLKVATNHNITAKYFGHTFNVGNNLFL